MPVTLALGATQDVAAGIFVAEITMATPDVICVEVRDPPIQRGFIQDTGTPGSSGYQAYITKTNPFTQQGEYVWNIGPDKSHLRFFDKVGPRFANRTALSTASNYAACQLGGVTVTNVYLASIPTEQGYGVANSALGAATLSTCRHLVFLQLSAPLPQGGPYRIINTAGAFKPQTFTFNDKVTRAMSIRSTQVGHRPGDAGKIAYLAVRIPGYGTEGDVDFVNTYGLTTFKIIDATGTVVYTPGTSINKRTDATTLTPDIPSLIDYASTTQPPWTATSVTIGNPTTIGYTGGAGDPVNGQKVILKGFGTGVSDTYFGGGTGILETGKGSAPVVSNVNTVAKTFTVAIDTSAVATPWAPGSWLPGFDCMIYPAYTANAAATHVFEMDYRALAASNLVGSTGPYRVWVPGLGVSDPFEISDQVWYKAAKVVLGGMYNQRTGMALDGRFGSTRPIDFRDGVTPAPIYRSLLPAYWTTEGETGNDPWINSKKGGKWNTVTFGGT